MKRAKALLVVEGPHDEAFIGGILRLQHGLKPCRFRSRVDPFWEKTIPTSFPHNDDLRMRMPVPSFYESTEVTLAIVVSVGDNQLANWVRDTIDILPDTVDALGIFLDADDKKPPEHRFTGLKNDLHGLPQLDFGTLGSVTEGTPRCGIYVFPDNRSQGTLENLLEECAEVSYPAAYALACGFVESVEDGMFAAKELKDFHKPSGHKKAKIAALASILRPGKAIQVSIADNRWLTAETLATANLAAVAAFVQRLLRPTDIGASGEGRM